MLLKCESAKPGHIIAKEKKKKKHKVVYQQQDL